MDTKPKTKAAKPSPADQAKLADATRIDMNDPTLSGPEAVEQALKAGAQG